MKAMTVLVLTTVAAMLGACAKGSVGSSGGTEGSTGVVEQSILGNWKDSCKVSGGGDYMTGAYNIVSVTASALVISGESYKSSDCSGNRSSSMKMTFSYEIPSRSTLGPDIFNFNTIVRKVTYLIEDQDVVNMMNTMAYCGFSDWVVGVEKDITDRPCLSGPKAGEAIYTIMKVTETQLQPGQPDSLNSGTTPESRHTQLATQVFSKVQ